jgi:hypothetical protein
MVNGKWGYIDKTGKTVIPYIYDWTYSFSQGRAIVRSGKKDFFIKKDGSVLKTPKCAPVTTTNGSFRNGLAAVKINKKYGFITTEGELAIDAIYDSVWGFLGELCSVQLNGKFVVINTKGEIVFEPDADGVSNFDTGIAPFRKGKKWGVMDDKGNIIKEPCYDQLSDWNEGYSTGIENRALGYELTRAQAGSNDIYINRKGEFVAYQEDPKGKEERSKKMLESLFDLQKKVEKKDTWDKAEWAYDDFSINKKGATRHFYFVLKWLKEKDLLTENGISMYNDKNNLGVGLYRSLVKEQAADFLDRCYDAWYEVEGIANYQIDPSIKFEGELNLGKYWDEYLMNIKRLQSPRP